MTKEEAIRRNRLREQAEVELSKSGCFLCGDAVFCGDYPFNKFVGTYDPKTGEVKYC